MSHYLFAAALLKYRMYNKKYCSNSNMRQSGCLPLKLYLINLFNNMYVGRLHYK